MNLALREALSVYGGEGAPGHPPPSLPNLRLPCPSPSRQGPVLAPSVTSRKALSLRCSEFLHLKQEENDSCRLPIPGLLGGFYQSVQSSRQGCQQYVITITSTVLHVLLQVLLQLLERQNTGFSS